METKEHPKSPSKKRQSPTTRETSAVSETAIVVRSAQAIEHTAASSADEIRTEALADLDAAVDRINGYKGDIFVGAYRIGAELSKIVDRQLWKQRVGDENKPRYKNFDMFVKAECGISTSYARQMMRVAAAFSEQEAADLGVSKLGIIVEAPPDTQQRLLDKLRNEDATKRDLLAEVKEVNKQRREQAEAKGETARDRSGRRLPPSKHSAKKGVTLALLEEPCKVELFAREVDPTTEEHRRVVPDADGRLDLKIQPWGCLGLENGAVLQFVLLTRNNECFLVVRATRES